MDVCRRAVNKPAFMNICACTKLNLRSVLSYFSLYKIEIVFVSFLRGLMK
jgi:hypothetical protein